LDVLAECPNARAKVRLTRRAVRRDQPTRRLLMIINVVGTMGAGKTMLVRKFMAQGLVCPDLRPGVRACFGYCCIVPPTCADHYVIGNYERVSGGCDGIRTQDEVRHRITRANQSWHHVLFEGMTVTTSVGSYFKFLGELAPGNHLFAFLHPPIEVCVERVLARRAARGADVKGFDPEGVVRHHAFVTRAIERAKEFGAPYTLLNWKRALADLNAAFGIRIRGRSKIVA
jgi:hypothetical protein